MRLTPILFLVVLPCLVLCLTPISDELSQKAYRKSSIKMRFGRDFRDFRAEWGAGQIGGLRRWGAGQIGGLRNSRWTSDVAGAEGVDGAAGATGNAGAARNPRAAAALGAAGAATAGVVATARAADATVAAAAVAAANSAAAAVAAGGDAAAIAEAVAVAALGVVGWVDAEVVNKATAAALIAAKTVGTDDDVIAEVVAVAATAAVVAASTVGADDASIAKAAAAPSKIILPPLELALLLGPQDPPVTTGLPTSTTLLPTTTMNNRPPFVAELQTPPTMVPRGAASAVGADDAPIAKAAAATSKILLPTTTCPPVGCPRHRQGYPRQGYRRD